MEEEEKIYRQKVLKQKVMKFVPLVGYGSSARWNPLAEINFRTAEEISYVAMIVGIMVKPDGEKAGGGGDSAFWDNSAAALIMCVIMHLMYKHHKEKLRLPCQTDIMSFLSSPDMDLKELFTSMKNYLHITPEEFLELPDEKGIPLVNPLKEIYGEYLQNFRPFSRIFKDRKIKNLEEQRLLLMLDEFPQLGNLKSIELALAVCAGYGIKVCIVAQDVNQLNKEYTKDNSIASNCHVHIYFTPNLDSGAATAESISKNLGKQTISTVSHSDVGGLGKGSNSESFTGRELMTPDEISHMSSEKELLFVAGHRPIYGNKFRYYL